MCLLFSQNSVGSLGGILKSALEICLFITDVQMRYEICELCDNRHTWVILISTTTNIPCFITAAHTELWIFAFLLLTNQNRYANEVLDMHIQ